MRLHIMFATVESELIARPVTAPLQEAHRDAHPSVPPSSTSSSPRSEATRPTVKKLGST